LIRDQHLRLAKLATSKSLFYLTIMKKPLADVGLRLLIHRLVNLVFFFTFWWLSKRKPFFILLRRCLFAVEFVQCFVFAKYFERVIEVGEDVIDCLLRAFLNQW